MFTGLVEEAGSVVAREPAEGEGARVTIAAELVLADAQPGDSISVNGVCLTVAAQRAGEFTADVMPETLERSTLGQIVPGDPVNLERAARVDARLGGHIVQGHVDGVGRVSGMDAAEHWTTLTIAVPTALSGYLAEKGSITVDGVSLTVSGVSSAWSVAHDPGALAANGVAAEGELAGDWFQVSLIPTTLQETTLGKLTVGDLVNLEVDVIAKYVERLLAVRSS